MSAFFRWAHSSGLTSTDLWAPVAEFVSRPADMRISERMVPSVGQVIDLADATGRLPGGERYRVPVLAAGLLGPRPEELFVVEGSEFHIASEPVNGVNDLGPYIKEFLGHANIATTSIYASADNQMVREAIHNEGSTTLAPAPI